MEAAELEAAGWRRLPAVRYSAALGPTFQIVRGGVLTVALIAQEHLGNDNLGIVHGGAMMTFADMALGSAVGHANNFQPNFVTSQLSIQLVSAGRVGQFITCNPEIVRKTRSLVFVRGLFEADGKVLASADGIFSILQPDKMAALKAG
jgi:acyl-coenzyme A thioesterase PaaI-like protein